MPAQFLQRALTQKIGIALARLGTLDDSFGDDSVGEIVCKSEEYASHFERDAQNPLGFRTGIEVAKVRRDGHADLRRGQQISGHKTISVQHHYLDRNDKRHLYHAQSQSRSIRKSFSPASKQRFSKCAAVTRSLLPREIAAPISPAPLP